jgi:alkylhydroperoxidase/carboxymuconolactone decarboxylase family protein YurZ
VKKTPLKEMDRGLMGILHPGHKALASMDEIYLDKVKEYYIDFTVERKGAALHRKVKELIIMSVCAAMARFGGTRLHLKRALLAGATPREVLEALQTAAIPAGLPVVWNGAAILADEIKKMKIKFK